MKVLFFRFLALYALFCTCSCMDGFFNSSGFDSMDEDFGMEFCTSALLGPLGDFCFENFDDNYLMEKILIKIFNEIPPFYKQLLEEMRHEKPPITREVASKINYLFMKLARGSTS